MNTRRLAVMVTISVILAACTTAARPAAPENERVDPSTQPPNPTTQVADVDLEAEAGRADSQDDSAFAPQPDAGDFQTTSSTTPVRPTNTTQTEVTQSETTTTDVAPSTQDITDLLDGLDSLLSSLGGDIDGLDDDLADVEEDVEDVDASLNANEGDIEE